jgi:SET domain-containing protein
MYILAKLVFGEQRIGLWASRDILKGQEILFDYGIDYWRHKAKMGSGVPA